MIRVVMFDLGKTLIDADDRPFPHVAEALAEVSALRAEEPLRTCLVSDYTMATPPVTDAKVTALFNEYLEILDRTGLRPFFEPVEQRITLSTHARVRKPDRRIFETALSRLGTSVPLKECLLITENADHIREARDTLKMAVLQFRSAESNEFDFNDWSKAPALIAALVNPAN
jgi:FMN phosphatase YigB (HAD superfamily)